jgi:hypothetical protein
MLKNGSENILVVVAFRRCNHRMSEEHEDVMERMQKMGEKFTEYRKYFKTHFKDMDFEIRDWNFAVGKEDKEYLVSFGCKVAIKPKEKAPEAQAKV